MNEILGEDGEANSGRANASTINGQRDINGVLDASARLSAGLCKFGQLDGEGEKHQCRLSAKPSCIF